jgi:hypothetical protein
MITKVDKDKTKIVLYIDDYNKKIYTCIATRISHKQPSICEPGSVVGIATGYGLDGRGIESWWNS